MEQHFSCIMCERQFAQIHAYFCKKCSHTLVNAPSELASCRADLAAATKDVERLASAVPAVEVRPEPPKTVRQVDVALSNKRAALQACRERILARKEHIAQLGEALDRETQNVAREKRAVLNFRQMLQNGRKSVSDEALREKKVEVVAQLFGLLPVFPTIDNTIRVVNFNVGSEEAYHLMDPDVASAIAGYFVKIITLMGKYLEIVLPNEIGMDNHRWTIRPRGVGLAPVTLHPRISGTENFKMAMKLLEQNAVRLCYDQGIIIRRGHEHEIAQNLFRLISYLSNDKSVGLGSSGPFVERVTLPARSHREDEEFVLV